MAAVIAQKTPISRLQENCERYGIRPNYVIRAACSEIGVGFIATVTVTLPGGLVLRANGWGQRMKAAKHAAAEAALPRLDACVAAAMAEPTPSDQRSDDDEVASDAETTTTDKLNKSNRRDSTPTVKTKNVTFRPEPRRRLVGDRVTKKYNELVRLIRRSRPDYELAVVMKRPRATKAAGNTSSFHVRGTERLTRAIKAAEKTLVQLMKCRHSSARERSNLARRSSSSSAASVTVGSTAAAAAARVAAPKRPRPTVLDLPELLSCLPLQPRPDASSASPAPPPPPPVQDPAKPMAATAVVNPLPRKLPDCLVNDAAAADCSQLKVYAIEYEPRPEKLSQRSFGFVAKAIPEVCPFKIYKKKDESVSIRVAEIGRAADLTPEERNQCVKFHRIVVQKILKLEKPTMKFAGAGDGGLCGDAASPDGSSGADAATAAFVLFVPLLRTQKSPSSPSSSSAAAAVDIDFPLLRACIADDAWSVAEPIVRFTPDCQDFSDAMLAPWYRGGQKPTFYCVDQVRHELTPRSPFPHDQQYATFEDYYMGKYALKIADLDQNLVRCREIPRQFAVLKPLPPLPPPPAEPPAAEPKEARKSGAPEFIPETLQKHPCPASLWRQAFDLPAILHRLEGLLLAAEFSARLAAETGLRAPQPPQKQQQPTLAAHNETKSGAATSLVGPSTAIVLQALTLGNAQDLFSLERLETLGDSALKLAASEAVFEFYPTADEGRLTGRRAQQISNDNLYRLGMRRRFTEMISVAPFDATERWVPPMYVSRTERAREAWHGVSTKAVADVVEALIGAFLLSGGFGAAKAFMKWIGIRVSIDFPASITEKLKNVKARMNESGFNIDGGYDFRHGDLLLEALTHPSFTSFQMPSFPCSKDFERLEFLGDAVLDVITTQDLFDNARAFDPGTLTLRRQLLVNNNHFGQLAVKHGFPLPRMAKGRDQILHYDIKEYRNAQNVVGWPIPSAETSGESPTPPKPMADVFESVAGAIYVDDGASLANVRAVYGTWLEQSTNEVQSTSPTAACSPITALNERVSKLFRPKSKPKSQSAPPPPIAKFEPSVATDVGFTVDVVVHGLGTFTGEGKNKDTAKDKAARKALDALDALEARMQSTSSEHDAVNDILLLW